MFSALLIPINRGKTRLLERHTRTEAGEFHSLFLTSAKCFKSNSPLHWPALSIVVRSRRRRGATGSALLPRGGRRLQRKETHGVRAADTESSANPNLQLPTTRPESEAGRWT